MGAEASAFVIASRGLLAGFATPQAAANKSPNKTKPNSAICFNIFLKTSPEKSNFF
jgi:hypothetical protein